MSIALEPIEGIIAGPYLGFLAATVVWIGRPFQSPLEAAFCVLACALVGVPALIAHEKGKILS
jgi:hypothetical protein